MEEDGSFSLKNLGKSSIFLNGKEVSTGQLMGLGSSSLIEVGVFAFEMADILVGGPLPIPCYFSCPAFMRS